MLLIDVSRLSQGFVIVKNRLVLANIKEKKKRDTTSRNTNKSLPKVKVKEAVYLELELEQERKRKRKEKEVRRGRVGWFCPIIVQYNAIGSPLVL